MFNKNKNMNEKIERLHDESRLSHEEKIQIDSFTSPKKSRQIVPLRPKKTEESMLSSLTQAAKIFSQHGDFIRAAIRYKISDENLVDDLYQNFFLSLVARPIPQNVRNVKRYLYRAIVNDSYDAVRRVEQYQDRIQRYSKLIGGSIDKASKYCPENSLIKKEETEKIFKAVELLLPSSESRAVTMRFMNNNRIGEVAKQMAVNKRSVSRYISIGLKKLRHFILEKEGT